MATNIGPKIGIDGEAEYRKKINNIIQQANTLASEMKVVAASFDSSTTAQEQAAAKSEVLVKQLALQEERVAELSKMLEASTAKYGEADSRTLKWQQSVNEAKAALLGMERELDSLNSVLDETNDTELTFDETDAKKALSVIEQEARTLASEMKLVAARFDENTTAQAKAEARSKVLSKQIENLKSRESALADAVDKSTEAYGENDSRTLKWQQSLNEARTDLVKLERELRDATEELEDVGKAADDAAEPIKDVGDAMDGAGMGALNFGEALKAGGIIEGAKAVIGWVTELMEATEDYRRIMASLEVSSTRSGYTAEETAEGYRMLYGVLGDEQSAATALANLQALHLQQEILLQVINGAIGAWSAYGDSIPIDGLAESINETVKAGKVTGSFADVLNWAGTNEDDFNAKLEAATTEMQRMAIVLDELSNQGLVELGEAWQRNNKDLVDANNAANDTTEAYARFAEIAAPSVNMVKQETANLLSGLVDLMTGTSQFDATFNQMLSDIVQAADEAFGDVEADAQALADGIEAAFTGAGEAVAGLVEKAAVWGGDFVKEYSKGILTEVPGLEMTVQELAALVNAYLHFSVPDVGPLSDADEYGPDFVKLLASGIREQIPELRDAVDLAADTMVIHPQAAAVGGSVSAVYRFDGINVNVYGAEGQSVSELAEAVTDAVMDMIQYKVTSKEAVFGA